MDEKLKKLKKFLKPTLVILTIIIVVFVLYKYYNRNTWKVGSQLLKIDRIDTTASKVIPNCEIVQPRDYSNYSVDFKIFIDNFNENHTFWRHVFHKGTYVNLIENINHKYIDQSDKNNGWTDLVKNYKEQSLGVWLHPNKNTLRICLTTRVNLDDRKNYDTNDHPYGDKNNFVGFYNNIDSDTIDQIEYCDLEDIPIKILTQITITLEKNVLSLYVNKILRKVCIFEGVPVFNNKPLFFVHQRTFDGYLQDFKLIPYFIKDTQVSKL